MSDSNFEFRREQQLPYVIDSGRDVRLEMLDLLGRVIDGELPGMGIVHDASGLQSQRLVHRMHGALVLEALSGSRPPIQYSPTFDDSTTEYWASGTPAHSDPIRPLLPSDTGLALKLRLHTADGYTGSRVKLVNSAAGYSMASRGDVELFGMDDQSSGQRELFQYDPGGRYASIDEMVMRTMQDTYDPLVTQPDIYAFTEGPLSSVLFRSATGLGPVAVHEFMPTDTARFRNILYSDLIVSTR